MKKRYILLGVFFTLFSSCILTAADIDAVGHNYFEEIPAESVVNIFNKLNLSDIPALRLVNKHYKEVSSDPKLIANLLAEPSYTLNKQVRLGLNLPRPLATTWYKNQKDRAKTAEKLFSIISSHQELPIARKALESRAELLGVSVNSTLARISKVHIKYCDYNSLQRCIQLGARPEDIDKNDLEKMYKKLFSKAIKYELPEKALVWLSMGAQPSNEDYQKLTAIYQIHRANISLLRFSYNFENDVHITAEKLKHDKINSPYVELLSKIITSCQIPKEFKKPIKNFLELSVKSKKDLEKDSN